ncbi:hypothetical protein LLG07_03325 [bacterium]|nr:hypothetical protein [bacterium]
MFFSVILIGVLSNFFPIDTDDWIRSVKEVVPNKILDLNLKVFNLGKNFKNNFKGVKCL